MTSILRYVFAVLAVLALSMSLWVAAAAWPARWWFDPQVLIVLDHARGDVFEVRFTGGASREFTGSYAVVMRKASDSSITAEGRGGPFPYKTTAKRPVPLLINWWVGDGWERFTVPPIGEYYLQTCWTVHRPFWGIVPDKQVCISSNIFKVE